MYLSIQWLHTTHTESTHGLTGPAGSGLCSFCPTPHCCSLSCFHKYTAPSDFSGSRLSLLCNLKFPISAVGSTLPQCLLLVWMPPLFIKFAYLFLKLSYNCMVSPIPFFLPVPLRWLFPISLSDCFCYYSVYSHRDI